MAELRWNPLINDWVIIASHRQNRPNMPKGYCPFCPGSGKVPDHYDVHKYDNDFPALSQNPLQADIKFINKDIYKAKDAYGKCEVILFSPEHESSMCEFSIPHLEKIIELWCERFYEIKKDTNIKYIFIFENRGEAVGVTMQHPHGQIYGYSVLPKKIELECNSFKDYKENFNSCLMCAINKEEKKFSERVVYENNNFISYIPYFSEYPYGIFISAKNHLSNITELDRTEKKDLAESLKMITGMYDNLFDTKFPYMMCMYNSPVNGNENEEKDYHFHIQFYPPMRSASLQKFNASSETGVWAHCNTTSPEEKAEELRLALKKFEAKF